MILSTKNNLQRHGILLCLFVFYHVLTTSFIVNSECNCNGTVSKKKTEDAKSVFNGIVMDHPNGKGVAKATVCLSLNNEIIARTQTNKKGKFSLPSLAPGTYLLSVCINNLSALEIGGIRIERDKTLFMNVFLKEKSLEPK